MEGRQNYKKYNSTVAIWYVKYRITSFISKKGQIRSIFALAQPLFCESITLTDLNRNLINTKRVLSIQVEVS